MITFKADDGREWTATALEEDTPRHHGRWYLVLHPSDSSETVLALPEVRWKTRATAERTLRTMSNFELRRRLRIATGRHDAPGLDRDPFGEWKGAAPGAKGGTAGG